MQVVHAREPFPDKVTRSIFLAGPSPRGSDVLAWRPEAIRILEELGYDGVVFNPESKEWNDKVDYDDQVDWEDEALNRADCIVFWVPRDTERLPGFTTNVEFGEWFKSSKSRLGAPTEAEKVRYLFTKARVVGVPDFDNLSETLIAAVEMTGKGSPRQGVECQIPLLVWNQPTFQDWYTNLKAAGNCLNSARVLWTFRFPPDKTDIFYWVLQVDVHITAEGRDKTNEVVIGRPNIVSVLMYHTPGPSYTTEVVLVREFRSPVNNPTGYVYELPGGSSSKILDPRKLAVVEVQEETGLEIDPERLDYVGQKQLAATMSAHQATLFRYCLDIEERDFISAQAQEIHGDLEATERTFVELWKIVDIFRDEGEVLDWANIGMIRKALPGI